MIYIQLKSARGSQKVLGYYVQLRSSSCQYSTESKLNANCLIESGIYGDALANNNIVYNASYNKYVVMRHSGEEPQKANY